MSVHRLGREAFAVLCVLGAFLFAFRACNDPAARTCDSGTQLQRCPRHASNKLWNFGFVWRPLRALLAAQETRGSILSPEALTPKKEFEFQASKERRTVVLGWEAAILWHLLR
ncbi:hypothetical protein B0H16DRAFT_1468424 [Mycena metata]|uniref:Secreted protein n=1 Tax=Mycena metata TaxID=1033252 RepID=A0AAD7I0U2_9AGAR|nr:hypothetical protein B0H16DRAFT_1468424 [Mycena metata]